MLTSKRMWLMRALAVSCLFTLVPAAHARTYSDRGASIIVLPKIVVDGEGTDTVVKLFNNDRDQPVTAHCFYVNGNSHCTNDSSVCTSSTTCGDGGSCVQDWQELDFDVVLTREQPLVWRASQGLRGDDLPCPDIRACPAAVSASHAHQSNAGTGVPPVPETPFLGELKCVQVDPANNRHPLQCGTPGCSASQNDLAGSATIEHVDGQIDTAQYNAIGIHTNDQVATGPGVVTSTGNDGDGNLAIGGSPADGEPHEYEPCPDTIVLNHLFDGASDPISGSSVSTTLTLVPCGEDLFTQTVTPITAQFLVYNEFEQRFSTSRQVRCLLDSQISLLDTTQSSRSIFSAGIAGTVAGTTRIHGVNGGLLGAAVLQITEGGSAAFNLNQQAERVPQDIIRIP